MPHIRVRSVPPEHVQTLSTILPKELSEIMMTDIDNFTVEAVPTQFFAGGEPVAGDPFVEVMWFDRGQTVQDLSAKAVTAHVSKLTKATTVTVVFMSLPKTAYYENGDHF